MQKNNFKLFEVFPGIFGRGSKTEGTGVRSQQSPT